ncbi:MAG: sigma-70 family RNA polymerase sigma factor [Candidatus Cloacimonetes bacterium]|nr:sigma-70 family RNA polymerase sigma factor [Candidatus Cloacimonadota bacterium]
MNEEIYSLVRNNAFNLANSMIRNYHDAEDIAQIVSLKYLLNQEEILNPIAWSFKVTKNEVYGRSKKNKNSEVLLQKEAIESFEEKKLENVMGKIQDYDKLVSLDEAKQLLSRDDYRIFRLWEKSNYKVSKVSKLLGLSYHSSHTRVYKMKRNLRAQKLKHEGYTTSKDIIDYNTNKKIVKFIKMFVDKMNSNDLKSLHSYLEHIPKEEIECLDIVKVLNYDIKLKDNMIHEILLPYFDSKNKVQFCGVRFKIDKHRRIKVTEFISKPKSVLAVPKPHKPFLEKLPKEEKGIIQNKIADIRNILQEDPP